jgi:CBS domain-containing protein
MKASDVMVSNVITVGPDARIQDVAELLLHHRISAVPVVGPQGEILGIVSEGDLINRPEAETERRRARPRRRPRQAPGTKVLNAESGMGRYC